MYSLRIVEHDIRKKQDGTERSGGQRWEARSDEGEQVSMRDGSSERHW